MAAGVSSDLAIELEAIILRGIAWNVRGGGGKMLNSIAPRKELAPRQRPVSCLAQNRDYFGLH